MRLIEAPGNQRDIEKRPRVTISSGSTIAIWRSRKGVQAAISSGWGSRFPGGRHLTTLAMWTVSRESPAAPSNWSRKRPAGPTKGTPCSSSRAPGASPMHITSAGAGPTPGTVWVR